jgi:hypothetical protein
MIHQWLKLSFKIKLITYFSMRIGGCVTKQVTQVVYMILICVTTLESTVVM